MSKPTSDYTLASLFCGAGGLDLGFHKAGFKCLWANDFNHDACDTFANWSGVDVVCGDIGKIDYDDIPATDVINGGFPCFVAGTLVETSSGNKPIEEISAGDCVLTHAGVFHRVLRAGRRDGASTIVLGDRSGRTIECTPEHPVLIRRTSRVQPEWVAAGDVSIGMAWKDAAHSSWSVITEVGTGRQEQVVYNLEVEEDNSYTANGIAVHNCQGFSAGGPRKLDDSRNSLYRHFVRLVDEKKPKAFVAENVKGLLSIGGSDDVVKAILSDFADKGYDVSLTLVNAADYGVPEDRMRTIIVGIRKDLGERFYMPRPFPEKKTLKDALENIASPAPEDVCDAPYSSRYMSRNRKRNWNQQSFTIPAMAKQVALWPGSPDMVKVDRDLWRFGDSELDEGEKTTRRLSWQEAAAIQTFPADLEFCGDLTSKYKQIGNAVPVQLGYVVATRLKNILDGNWSRDNDEDWIEPTYKSWEE